MSNFHYWRYMRGMAYQIRGNSTVGSTDFWSDNIDKGITKALHNWPFVRGIHRWPACTHKAQWCGNRFHDMTSSCHSWFVTRNPAWNQGAASIQRRRLTNIWIAMIKIWRPRLSYTCIFIMAMPILVKTALYRSCYTVLGVPNPSDWRVKHADDEGRIFTWFRRPESNSYKLWIGWGRILAELFFAPVNQSAPDFAGMGRFAIHGV